MECEARLYQQSNNDNKSSSRCSSK
jgi:hypothetical protein